MCNFWDSIYNNRNKVFFRVRLVSFFRGVRIGEMVVVEIWHIFVVEMPVIVSWTSEIVLDSKAFIIISKT